MPTKIEKWNRNYLLSYSFDVFFSLKIPLYKENLWIKHKEEQDPKGILFAGSSFLGSLWTPVPFMLSGLCSGSPSLCGGPTPGVCGSRPGQAALPLPHAPSAVPCSLGTRRKPQQSWEIIHPSNHSKVFKLSNRALRRRKAVFFF